MADKNDNDLENRLLLLAYMHYADSVIKEAIPTELQSQEYRNQIRKELLQKEIGPEARKWLGRMDETIPTEMNKKDNEKGQPISQHMRNLLNMVMERRKSSHVTALQELSPVIGKERAEQALTRIAQKEIDDNHVLHSEMATYLKSHNVELSGLRNTHPDAGLRFDQLLAYTLDNNDGVFLGEDHQAQAIKQAATKLLPLSKAHGAGTISYEFPQAMMDELVQTTDPKELKGLAKNPKAQAAYVLAQAAKNMGFTVLGHEKPDESTPLLVKGLKDPKSLSKEDKAALIKWRQQMMDGMGNVTERDEYAAKYIAEHKKGKVIVIGGLAHSGNFKKEDAKEPEAYSFIVGSNYKGLPPKLHIPAIDYEETQYALGRDTGTTKKTDGRFHDYKVVLPEDLGKLNTTSWPPQPRLPQATGKKK